jgi:MoxR-like ATPase
MALPVLRHRLILKPEAEIEGLDADAVIKRILAQVEVPR